MFIELNNEERDFDTENILFYDFPSKNDVNSHN